MIILVSKDPDYLHDEVARAIAPNTDEEDDTKSLLDLLYDEQEPTQLGSDGGPVEPSKQKLKKMHHLLRAKLLSRKLKHSKHAPKEFRRRLRCKKN